MISNSIKKNIVAAIAAQRANYPSDAKHAAALGMTKSVYSEIKNGNAEGQVSNQTWISLARRLEVRLKGEMEWKTAATPVFKFIEAQLKLCQESSLSGILCDMPNIGKTYTARIYCQQHKNAIYIDCSQVKTKRKMIKKIANEFGVNVNGRYYDIYEDLVYYLRSLENPLIVLDEAGDLQYEAFLELKALWNATEKCCAWYMMGADGLRAKINRNIEGEKVGYTEMLSRYGDRFSKVTPDDGKEREQFLLAQAKMVAKVNAPENADYCQIALKAHGGLRRVYTEIEKIKRA